MSRVVEYNSDRTGWAEFSADRVMRYRLARSLDGRPLEVRLDRGIVVGRSVCFLMLNPSTADAFKPDPTVGECIKRARRLGGDVLQVANLFALRSPYPADLRKRAHGFRGDDQVNNAAIASVCDRAYRVIAAWGNGGALDCRAEVVRSMLADWGVDLYHLGLTEGGFPKHPLARGKHRIPEDLEPVRWV